MYTRHEEFSKVAAALGRVIRERRHHIGRSGAAVAQLAGMDRTYLSMIERGIRQPTVAMLIKVARALDAKPESLLAETLRFLG